MAWCVRHGPRGRGGQSQHPLDEVRAGEALIKSAYEALRASPLWVSSLLIVTWEEHGGFYDHAMVVPGGARSSGQGGHAGRREQVRLHLRAVRLKGPAVVVSARILRNLIDHRTYDHACIPATAQAPAIRARVAAISTRGQACQYLEEVAAKAATEGPPVRKITGQDAQLG